MLNGNVDEWPVSCFGKVTGRRRGKAVEEVVRLGVEERDTDEITE